MHTSAVPSTTPSRWLDIKSGIVILDVLLLCAMLAWLPFDPMVNKGLGILVFIAILWLTEALHVTITALLVPLLATVLGVLDMSKSLTDFANPILFLFFGGFALAAALSKQGLDTLMAGKVMHLANGHLGWGIILLFTITAAMSMWISNTATTAMMLPLAIGMLARLDSKKERATFVFVLLGIAYSASIGGIGTLVGSPPNAIAAAQMGIGFTDWMKFGVPVVLILMPCGIALLYLVTRPQLNHRVEIQDVTIILLMLAAFVVFLTELVSNTATAALLIPLFAGVAEALGVSPIVMAVLIAIGASCAFMLPVATPPNAIVFASGHIRQKEMMKAGMALNVVFTVLLAGLAYFVGDIL
ncbi:NadC family protein [Aeromonas salmonicida subsp. salmonicida]|uniref:Transporter, NadC family n=2 Tax=Aeromonas salmonicida subsp. salmonicida TaxID=29491 RepID=A4SN66_AERS4|nr:SLC13 family permease [Aeromonas salmonicida]ABO90338.1 transporter, NadC family [Aeromonas salmonicida subsp. salmonicida A449]AYO63352.1 NadC family protein [Aeromonas salmonicida subsp. salmonicida 01-B526]EHI53899.1 NadC family protein [Aeromonas salmonicida subsp. salmonicida 01-B526]EKP0238185.1 SLC13/DASS family transporter [Aeromonas salmonicida]EKP0242367.1 SLC13/DASS family transporter [Aeromonas salmonicida]